MLGISDYGAFVVAVILFLMIPGPGNLALITSTGKGGMRAGMACCFGCMAADQLLMWLAVAGGGWRWLALQPCWLRTLQPSMPCSGWARPIWALSATSC